ncbi:putative bifunctional diguanylate cyclase/phosphodiesterase [Rhizobium sp. 9140]|uniref:putative bifunctional diguanylate cyclase/phosphodiesterase n=1 Tax=Rhizobium sp. 9140 TaxID=1761900 RepID=UPI000796CCC1|nr:bifunctional diguanylate cyclase/phosphodiesterase [Rhizobium sp. 9140]CZT34398.1 diguanylate cyclase (GGDEF) domain-containing protein [Rhizobium sp. 9140]
MTLGKRAVFLIFPIVLAGYLLAACLVYVVESKALLSLERARIFQQLDHAEALFRADANQSRSFLYSLLEGNALRLFMSEPDASYRNNALSLRIQESIRMLSDDMRAYVSFSILQPDSSIGYYFENSDDPFAEISPAQMTLARTLFKGERLRNWTYLNEGTSRPLIVYSEFIDPTTFSRALPSNKDRALLVQVAVQPDQFLAMVQSLQREYATAPQFTSEAPKTAAPGELSASVELIPALHLTLRVPQAYASAALWQLTLVLGVGTIGMSLISIGLMITLIRRFITDPIAALDHQVTAVMDERSEHIVEAGGDGEIGRLTGNIKKLHDQSSSALRRVQEASWTDALTGMQNRSRFNVLAGRIVQEAVAGRGSAALLFIDIDHFKFVNDKHGHEVGDELLRVFATRVRDAVAPIMQQRGLPEPMLARLSGDEFAVLIQAEPGAGAIREACDAILALFTHGFEVQGKIYPVTASIGVALCPRDADSVAALISNADAAMYQAKTSGKNQSSRFSRNLQDKRDRVRQIQEELRVLDPDEQFHLVYMPIVDQAGAVTGCEALLRWTSPTLGRVTPDEFVPIAESSGQFTKIDWWVVSRAMADYGKIRDMFGPQAVLAINISSAELHSRSIGDHFSREAARYGIAPDRIEIELTETYAVKLGDQLHRNIEALRSRGFRISIDDFGAGYTSVQQIIEYTADTIKLDRAIVETMATPDLSPALTALIALCHARGMAVIGEGVDNERKVACLTHAGCDFFQGYLISKPLALDELGIWALHRLGETALMPHDEHATMIGPRKQGTRRLL